MPAPTALLRRPEELAEAQVPAAHDEQQDEPMLAIESDQNLDLEPFKPTTEDADFEVNEEGQPIFAPAKAQQGPFQVESRKVPVPPHRMTPLRKAWPEIYPPLVEHLKLQVRMNTKSKAVELRNSEHTTDSGALQKGEDFVKAFTLGFDVRDAVALLRLDDLYIETFEIKDVKTLQGDHAGRAIGRIAGRDGKTKMAIENASKTRVVLADQKIHILGGFRNIHIAREAIVSLILGTPPDHLFGSLVPQTPETPIQMHCGGEGGLKGLSAAGFGGDGDYGVRFTK